MKKNNCSKFGNYIVDNYAEYERLAEKYNIVPSEIVNIDLNRNGISLPNNEVRENFRVRFKGTIVDGYESWYALPVRNVIDTPFSASDGIIYCFDKIIGSYDELRLDTCESSYQRGPYLLNLNSRSRSSCGGCKACVHNYHNLYDSTVIKDNTPLKTEDDLNRFFDSKNIDVSQLNQIAVVTGLFGGEKNVLEHMNLVNDVATDRGFNGELIYFGCEVNSKDALDNLAKINNFVLIYALDNFSKRDLLLTKTKSLITLEDAKRTLDYAKSKGIETTISYISGIDSLDDMKLEFNKIKESLTRFPVVNIYQVQTSGQASIMNDEAKYLEYYILSRIELEKIFRSTGFKPKRWENYRPLWYDYYDGEKQLNNAYGQQETLVRRLKK